MTSVHSKALDRTVEVERIIGHAGERGTGPTLVFMGGIHGNEPSGVLALHQVIAELRESGRKPKGNMYAVSGNLWALERGMRYAKHDLNRLWNEKNISLLRKGAFKPACEDDRQMVNIHETVMDILAKETGPFFFFDLHTTSGETVPFLTVNDSLLNRRFTVQYPLPIILGIEEYLDGPLLSYINELGHVAFGFEAGRHEDLASVENHVAFIYLSLVYTGFLSGEDIDYQRYHDLLARNTMDARDFFEIYFRYAIRENEEFRMRPGYHNFQKVHKGEELADSDGRVVHATHNGRIFMPLYQSQGSDGFFAIRKVSPFFLRLSAFMRREKLDRTLTWLPGVRAAPGRPGALMVDRRIARFFAKQFFHLFGYRSRRLDRAHYIMKSREATSRYKAYKHMSWMRAKPAL